jgi:bacterioferritin
MNMAEQKGSTADVIKELKRSYDMEIETVINYLANSIHLDGFYAMEIRELLKADVQEELGHATQLAERIKVLHGKVPGSLEIEMSQKMMQPPAEPTDVLSIIRGVIDAEDGAIKQYQKIIKMCDGWDYVTQDLAITLMADEEKHRREFEGFLRDIEHKKSAK